VTVTDERPRNGHAVAHTAPTRPLDAETGLDEGLDDFEHEPAAVPAGGAESERVRALRQRVADRTTERDLLHRFVEVDTDPVFDDVRSEAEAQKDREVAEKVRGKARTERRRAGEAEVRRARRNRRWDWWDERATRARDRILDPARAVGADYRKLVASSVAAFALIAGGVAFMATNVHDGLVGTAGSWTAYLVEPLASVLLAISMVAQFTARKRGIAITRGFYLFDGALAAASVLLNVLPSGFRFGWLASDLVAHFLVPGLVVAAVIAWHLASSLYGQAIALSKDAPIVLARDDQITGEHLALLRKATAEGRLPVYPSVNQVIKTLRDSLKQGGGTGIGHEAARRVAAIYLGGR
jgi:hypothetical protein